MKELLNSTFYPKYILFEEESSMALAAGYMPGGCTCKKATGEDFVCLKE